MAGGVSLAGIFIPLLALFLFLIIALPNFIVALSWQSYVAYAYLSTSILLGFWFFSDASDEFLIAVLIPHFIGIFTGFILYLFRSRQKSKNNKIRPRVFAVSFFVIFFVVPVVLEMFRWGWHFGYLPKDVNVSGLDYLHRQIGTSCELTVWSLDEIPEALIARRDAPVFSKSSILSARLAINYGYLHSTPYPTSGQHLDPRDRWLRGIGCSKVDSRRKQQIIDALLANEAFFARSNNHGIIIIPNLKLAIHSFGNEE